MKHILRFSVLFFVLLLAALAVAQPPDVDLLDPASGLIATGLTGAGLLAVQALAVSAYKLRQTIRQVDTWREAKIVLGTGLPSSAIAFGLLSQVEGPLPMWQRAVLALIVGFLFAVRKNSADIGEGDGSSGEGGGAAPVGGA